MIFRQNIRKLYTPIQPFIQKTDQGVSYQEQLPDKQLNHLIHCYWNLKTSEPLKSNYQYNVVSDGCIDIYVNLLDQEEVEIMGFSNFSTSFDIGNQFNYFGIRFYPGIYPSLFKIDASDLANRSASLEVINPKLKADVQCLWDTPQSFRELCQNVDRYFIASLAQREPTTDKRFLTAMDTILQKRGWVRLETELNHGISSRHLRRLFAIYIGDTAKTFCRVVRFQNLLNRSDSARQIVREKAFYDVGYYDQTHFIKEFRQFYGTTPNKA